MQIPINDIDKRIYFFPHTLYTYFGVIIIFFIYRSVVKYDLLFFEKKNTFKLQWNSEFLTCVDDVTSTEWTNFSGSAQQDNFTEKHKKKQ
jgi:K+-transporting ATPase A subunit